MCTVHIHFSMSKIMLRKISTICNKLASKCIPLNNNEFIVYSVVFVCVFINDLILWQMLIIIRGAVFLQHRNWWKSITQIIWLPPVRLEHNWKFQQWVNYINRTCCGWNWFWFTTFADSLKYDDDDGEYIDCWLYWGCT